MLDAWIGTGFLLVVAIVSRVFYWDNKKSLKRHEENDPIESQPSFVWAYGFIKLTTMVVAPLCFFFDFGWLLEWHDQREYIYLGIVVSSLGLSLFVFSKLHLGEHYNPCYKAFMPKEIVQVGVYRFIRHPIYVANFLILVGAFVSTGSFWIALNVLILSVYYTKASQLEEKALSSAHPEYASYVAQTGAFFPRIGQKVSTDSTPVPKVNLPVEPLTTEEVGETIPSEALSSDFTGSREGSSDPS